MLTMKDVIREGHPTLKQRAKPVSLPLSDEDKLIAKDMMQFLVNSQTPETAEEYELRPGVGLAAPQINIKKRMTAILTTDETGETLYKFVLINPRIIRHSVKETYLPGGEGCLSVDRDVEGLVPRHQTITVRSHVYDIENDNVKKVKFTVKGYVSVVIQHEIDHLNGILFVEKLNEVLPDAEPVVFPTPEIDEETDNLGGEKE